MATSVTTLTGCVKWFDNGLNYGFITVLSEGANHNADIFVHQSNIRTKRDCFRTLYTGECVQFELAKSDNEKHPYHAVNVTGFNGGQLHCENPSYRGFRGNSRGGSRGGFRSSRSGFHSRSTDASVDTASGNTKSSPSVNVETKQASSETPVTAESTTPVESTKSGNTSQHTSSRRGRGRGKSSH